MNKEELFTDLNPQQQEALFYTQGPLLVLAGAGSGKTKVITYKYAYLRKEESLSPSSIFTVTFTNKAADEMKQRISSLIGSDLQSCWIGTFHSQCCRILRKEIKVLNYRADFIIYDEVDKLALIKHILKELNIYEALYKGVASRISNLKSAMITPEEFLSTGDGFGFDEKLAKVYLRYQDELKRCNAVDYDDLIMLTVKLFKENPKLLSKYHERFKYILIDEFQDTNYAQYELIRLLAYAHKNIAAVGDDDQSIYRFRGAEVKNIQRFEKDFPELKIVKLEQNYRSTQNILAVSGAVISQNPMRKKKRLWTQRERGEKVYFYWLPTEEDEAKYVAKKIRDVYLKGVYSYGDIAILYRINLQSRAIEDALRAERIPYRIVGGMSFYERKEIKDIIAYLRLIHNPHDNVSLRRIINIPPRGIGIATLNKIEQESKRNGVSLYKTIKDICEKRLSSQTVIDKLQRFINLIKQLRELKFSSVADIIKNILEQTGYRNIIEEERLQNIAELIVSAKDKGLEEFLESVSLITKLDDEISEDKVSLMTIHMAKGLEFSVVFIVGLEEGVMPYFKSMDSEEDLCEERRLFYVGMTRAKDILFLTGAKTRKVFSNLKDQQPSRFIKDIPRQYCYWVEKIPCKISISDNGAKSKKRKITEIGKPYKTGCRVKHPKWGIGVVRECYGEGEEMKVCVNFPKVGVKRLALKYAQLEKI